MQDQNSVSSDANYEKNWTLEAELSLSNFFVIHGIHVCGIENGDSSNEKPTTIILAVWGGRSLQFVSCSKECSKYSLSISSLEHMMNDWILDCISVEENSVLCLTAHNSVWLLQADTERHPCQLTRHCLASCTENCILYSGQVLVAPSSGQPQLLVCAGTPFLGVLLWSMPLELSNSAPVHQIPVQHRLCHHKGVIFSLKLDWTRGLLFSTSDDRSVCVYTRSGNPADDLTSCEWHLLWRRVEHVARVWSCVPLCVPSSGLDALVSVGEDCQVVVWKWDTGTVLHRCHPHKGRGIWTVDVDSATGCVITGGNDGAICELLFSPAAMSTLEQSVHLIPSTEKESVPKNKADFPRGVFFDYRSRLFVLTDRNEMWQLQTSDNGRDHLERLVKLSRPFCCFSVAPHRMGVMLGGACGDVLWLTWQDGSDVDMRHLELVPGGGKVMSVVWVASSHLILTMHSLHAFLFRLEPAAPFIRPVGPPIDLLAHQKGRQRQVSETGTKCWITAAVPIPSASSEQLEKICVGDRMGAVQLLTWNEEDARWMLTSSNCASSLHGSEGVTDLLLCDGASSTSSQDICLHYLLSIGKNGSLLRWKLYRRREDEEWQLNLLTVHMNIEELSWMDRFLTVADESQILLLGFQGQHFVCVEQCLGEGASISGSQTVFQFPCGGGHRSWAFHPPSHNSSSEGGNPLKFAFIQKRAVHLVKRREAPCEVRYLKPSLHGREICFCRAIPLSTMKTQSQILCVTGSENTELCSWTVSMDSMTSSSQRHPIGQICTHSQHMSSVRCSAVFRADADSASFTLVTGGGRGQLHVWRITTDSLRTTISWLSEVRVSLGEMAARRRRKTQHVPTDKTEEELAEMDLRVMSLQCLGWDCVPNLLLVVAACSDGSLKFVSVEQASGKCRLLSPRESHHVCEQHCITSLNTIHMRTSDESFHASLLTSSTDGYLRVHGMSVRRANTTHEVDVTNQLNCPIPTRGCSISSVDCMQRRSDNVFVVYGCDDGGVGSCTLIPHDQETEDCLNWRVHNSVSNSQNKEHVTAVSRVKFLPGQFQQERFLSLGRDQRIVVYMIQQQDSCIVALHHFTTVISDPQDMDIIHIQHTNSHDDTKCLSVHLIIAGDGVECKCILVTI